jgi:EAL and modified HD-GYP domain-containing signal transduction protein
MKSFFQRVLPKALQPAPTPAPEAAPSAPKPAAPQAAPAALTVRRPLMSSSGEIAGFEFRIATETQRALTQSGDTEAQAAHVAATLVGARLVAMTGRVGLGRVPAAWLVHASVPKNESGTLIGVEFDPSAPLAPDVLQAVVRTLQQFKAAGALLAWDAAAELSSSADPGFQPDYLLVRPARQPVAAMVEALGQRPELLKNIPVIATDLASIEDLELAVLGGIAFVSGDMAASARPLPDKAVPLPPEAGRLTQLVGQLASGADTADLVSEIKGNIGVSFRLLQRMNSPAFAHLGGVASIDQAVAMLGRNELHRWLSLMLMQYGGNRKLGSALQEVALWRSRLVELLAIERGEREPGRFFTLGLASMLGLILKIPQAEVVAALSLPPEAEDALLSQSGPWFVYLRTAMQVESQSHDDASAAVDGFCSAARVQELSDQAWEWAAQNSLRETPGGTAKTA